MAPAPGQVLRHARVDLFFLGGPKTRRLLALSSHLLRVAAGHGGTSSICPQLAGRSPALCCRLAWSPARCPRWGQTPPEVLGFCPCSTQDGCPFPSYSPSGRLQSHQKGGVVPRVLPRGRRHWVQGVLLLPRADQEGCPALPSFTSAPLHLQPCFSSVCSPRAPRRAGCLHQLSQSVPTAPSKATAVKWKSVSMSFITLMLERDSQTLGSS